jgi:hypothetical protein
MEDYDRMRQGKHTKRFLIITVSLMVFLAVYTVAFQWYFGPPSMPDIQYQLSNKGQRETMQKIVASLEDDNAAKYYLMACLEMTPIPQGSFYADSCPEVSEEISQENISELEDCIAAHETVFALFEDGIEQEHFFLPAEKPFEKIVDMGQFIRLARLVEAKGGLHEQKGHFEEAMKTYLDQLRFSADLYNNNSLGKALSGSACEHGAYRGLESLLARLDDETLFEGLLQELIEIEHGRAPVSRILQRDHEELMDSSDDEANSPLYRAKPPIDPGPGDYFLDTMSRTSGHLYGSAVGPIYARRMDTFYQALIEISEKPYPEILREPLKDRIPTDTMTEIMLPAIEKAFPLIAWQEVTRRGYILKVALRLHCLCHGEYPESLEELSVTLPEEMLVDPLSTNRFIYRKTGDGYLFYSFGVDLDDDGGKPDESLYDKNKDGDIVFEPPVPFVPDSQRDEGGSA